MGGRPSQRAAQRCTVTQAVCFRCGLFLASEGVVLLGANAFCAACARRPDVDYVEAFRLKHWGRRDGWAWIVGLSGLMYGGFALAAAIGTLTQGGENTPRVLLGSAMLFLFGAVNVAFFFKVRPARWAVGALWLAVALFNLTRNEVTGLPVLLVTVVLLASMLTNWRTRLFFELPVPRAKLESMWRRYHDNVLARAALTLAVGGLLLPPLAPAALVLGVVGLRRVDPKAWPPVGRRGYALAGIMLGAVATLGWGVVLASAALASTARP